MFQTNSGVMHGEWWAVKDYELTRCVEPFHRFHLIPTAVDNVDPTLDFGPHLVDRFREVASLGLALLVDQTTSQFRGTSSASVPTSSGLLPCLGSASTWIETKLQQAIQAAESPECSDDVLARLMTSVEPVVRSVEELREHVTHAQDRITQIEEATQWVIRNGSPRLRKALQTGTLPQSLGAYRDERLALERPHWTWWDRQQNPVKSIVNPTEADLDALIEAHVLDPKAELMFMPGVGAVVTSTFLQRPIYRNSGFGADDEPS